jgi:Tol biopolymer transport system component
VNHFYIAPRVSPDRQRIVAIGGQPYNVFAMRINGTGVRRLTGSTQDYLTNSAPSFSADSRHILWSQSGGDAAGPYLMNVDGSGQHLLTSDGGQDPVFSPNGGQIAYTAGGISIANADGSGSRVVLPDQIRTTTNPLARYVEQNSEPSWAPDGRIVFSRRASTLDFSTRTTVTARDVYVMNADGSDVRQLTSTPSVDEVDPAASPDGRMIAYFRLLASRGIREGQIWVMNADGSGQRAVARGTNPEWSTVQRGPTRPRLRVRLQLLNRHGRCTARYDGFSASVQTTALRGTRFDIAYYLDGRFKDEIFTALGTGGSLYEGLRRGRHRLKVVASDPALHDRISRTITFRRC